MGIYVNKPIYLRSLSICGNTVVESWLKDANGPLQTGGSISADSPEGALWAPPGYSFIGGAEVAAPVLWV